MKNRERSAYCIQTVEHALNVLEQFQGDAELGITELSNRLKLHKNKVFRLLATLESRNYVEQHETMGNYRLGVKNLHLGQSFIRQMGLLQQSRPVQEELVRKCNETSYVSILKNYQTIYIDVVESEQPVRVVQQLGARLPLHCTAAGKVLASNMNEENLRKYLLTVRLMKYTENTIDNPYMFLEHIRDIAKTGYAIDDEELDKGVKSIGAPIRDYSKQIIGALSISVPTMRITCSRTEQELVPLVMEAANEISVKLGYYH